MQREVDPMRAFLPHGNQRYLLLIPIVFLLLFSIYNWYSTKEIQKALLQEKYNELVLGVDVIADLIDEFICTDKDWGIYDYESKIKSVVVRIDESHQAFASVYGYQNGRLVMLTERKGEFVTFEPLNYPEFIKSITRMESGRLLLEYSAREYDKQDMHLYFRWIPFFDEPNGPILVVTSVSYDSISVPMALWVSIGQWVGLFVTFILETFLILMICKINNVKVCAKWKRGESGCE
jgi:hypothetical protein